MYTTAMKKISIVMISILVISIPSLGLAASTPIKAAVKTTVIATHDTKVQIPTESSSIEALRALPLSIRKETVERHYRDLLARLTAISARIQTTIDRLSEKHMDITSAEISLTAANLA